MADAIRDRSRSPLPGSSGSLPRSSDLDKMELTPDGQVRNVYCISDDQEVLCSPPLFEVLQRGAGTGKTFESLQWLTLTDFVQFIYAVKQHSAKDVILAELKEQLKKECMRSVEFINITEYNRGYHVELKRDGVDVQAIILTVDSLFCALRETNFTGGDFYLTLASNIAAKGASRIGEDGNVQVKGKQLKMGRDVLLVLDEAQDADCCYCDALKRIHDDWGVSIRVIGDKLQSPGVVRTDGANRMRRFGSQKLRDFVNLMVPFEEYDCPLIELHPDVVGQPGDYEIFKAPTRQQLYKDTHMTEFMATIMERVRRECSRHRMPEDFLFMIPGMSGNPLVERLETELQLFWEQRFSDETFVAGLADDHWRSCAREARQYVMVHHSETRGSIDLTVSERATRIQTIHSAKGTGRKVVFLLGCTQNALELSAGPFSRGKQNVVFESLLHVALTRMKEQLYISTATDQVDEICRRLKLCQGVADVQETVHSLDDIHADLKSDFLTRCLVDEFSKAQSTLKDDFEFQQVIDGLEQSDDPNGVVDWGHHLLRNAAMHYRVLAALPHRSGAQVAALHRKLLCPVGIRTFKSTAQSYYQAILCMQEWTWQNFEKVGWPVMQFRRGVVLERFGDASPYIGRFVLQVQKKLRENADQLPQLCPLEALTFFHMHSQVEKRAVVRISAVELNQIFMAYLRCATLRMDFGCADCTSYWLTQSTTTNMAASEAATTFCSSLCKHYELVARVDACMGVYLDSTGDYNIAQMLSSSRLHASGQTGDFSLGHFFTPVVGYGERTRPLVLQPSLNKLNITEGYARIVAAAFIAYFTIHKELNMEQRYRGKAVHTSVISLDHSLPTVFEFTPMQLATLRGLVKTWMRAHFQSKHDLFLRVYETVFARDAGLMHEKVKKTHKKIPPYLLTFLDEINRKRDRVMYATMEIGTLREKLDRALDDALDVFYEQADEEAGA